MEREKKAEGREHRNRDTVMWVTSSETWASVLALADLYLE